jgi:hypothetical protein
MEKLNELVALAEKADAVANLIDGVNPHTILAIAEAFRALLQRAEAAEAKLAELAQQKPIGWLNDAYLGRGVIDGEVGQDDFGPGYIPIYSHPFNDAPAPAADLADLVPDAKAIRKEAGGYAPVYSLQEQQLFIDGATWLRAAILLNIEEMSK